MASLGKFLADPQWICLDLRDTSSDYRVYFLSLLVNLVEMNRQIANPDPHP